VNPSTPDDLRAVLPVLFEQKSALASCVWVEAVHSDPPAPQSTQAGPWTTAWDDLFLRINERRDALRRHLSGGLVLAVPQEMKARARDAAPDLWSVRSLVIDLQPTLVTNNGTISRAPIATEPSLRDAFSETAIDVEFALAEAKRIEGKENFRPETLAPILFRAIEGLLEQSQIHDAVATAEKTLAMLRDVPNQDNLVAEALQLLGRAEEADNDLPAAVSHITEAVSFFRILTQRGGGTPQNFHNLSLALNHLGNIQTKLQNIDAATITHEEEVKIDRLLSQRLGETPQALRDLSISLDNLGNVQREAGQLSTATTAYEESLALRRRLLETLGETPQALRDLSISLDNLGDVQREAGQLSTATTAYQESFALRRSWFQMYDEPPPQAIQDLITSLSKLKNIHSETGNNSQIEALSQERETLERQLAVQRDSKSAS